MTAKLKHIVEQLNAMVTFNVDKSMTDDDFIANVDAINLLCNLYDDLGLTAPKSGRIWINSIHSSRAEFMVKVISSSRCR